MPTVKRDDDYYKDEGDTEAAKGDVTKLPDIGDIPKSGRHQLKFLNENIKDSNDTITRSKRSSKKLKFIKRLSNGERLKRIYPADDDSHNERHDGEISNDKKLTPEGAILRLTGGVELVPLLARRRRVGARTLPSSDVTRPPEQPCQYVLRQINIKNNLILLIRNFARCRVVTGVKSQQSFYFLLLR